MKRFLPVASALAVLTACGAGHVSAPQVLYRAPVHKLASGGQTKASAVREARQLLAAFVPPHGAVRVTDAAAGRHVLFRDPGRGIFGKQVHRHRVWRIKGSVHSVESLRPKGWGAAGSVTQAGRNGQDASTQLTFVHLGFRGRSPQRLLVVYAVQARGGGAFLRADVVVVWRLPAAVRADLPAGVRTIAIVGPHVSDQVTDPAQVRTIVRWFDGLELFEPRFVVRCPYVSQPSFQFVFRGAHGGELAQAGVPEYSGICSAASYTVRGHEEPSLIGGDIVYRVQQLIGANWIGSPDVEGLANQRRADAQRTAAKLLHDFTPPPGARRTHAPKEYGMLSTGAPLGEFVDDTRYWRVPAKLGRVVSFVRAHDVPRGFQEGGGQISVPGHPPGREFDFYAKPVPSRYLEINALQTHDGSTILRVDAQVVWVYPRSPRERVPSGVHEIDIAGLYSAKVTDSAKIEKIVGWFDGLEIVQPGLGQIPCLAFLGKRTTFVFRGASGAVLARTSFYPDNPPLGGSGVCNPFTFSIHGRNQTPLLGGRFVGRVRELLGIRVSDERSGG